MAPRRAGLGKGLDALLQMEPASGDLSVALDRLRPNPEQPRKHFGKDELEELADSIREHGIIEPIIVQEAGDGGYTIIAGERRYRAALLAGLREAPVLVRSYSPELQLEIALIENIQRTDLNPVEEARAYRRLMDLSSLSQDAVAAKVGKNRSTVANALRLLRLPAEVQDSLIRGVISPGHARAILQAARPGDQGTLFREIVEQGLSVREAERRAGELNGARSPAGTAAPAGERSLAGTAAPAGEWSPAGNATLAGERSPAGNAAPTEGAVPPRRAPELTDMEGKLIEKFGTKVSVQGTLEKGSIRIDYYSMDDLDRLYDIILGS